MKLNILCRRVLCCFAITFLPLQNAISATWPANSTSFHIGDLNGTNNLWENEFEEAVYRWNDIPTQFRVSTIRTGGSGYCTNSGDNVARFSATWCGNTFGSSTLAVTSFWTRNGTLTKADITFNTAKSWSIYDGSRQFSAFDFRRVAVHEMGHALGLPHTNASDAIMRPSIGDTYLPTFSDTNDLRNLYGSNSHTLTIENRGDGVVRITPLVPGTVVESNNTLHNSNYGLFLDCTDAVCQISVQDGLRLSITATPNNGENFINWEGIPEQTVSADLDAFTNDKTIVANFSSTGSGAIDTDGDGIIDDIDSDDDNDGVLDSDDAFPLDSTESVDTDGDGIGNNADTDDDGDGVSDSDDDFPLDPTKSSNNDGGAGGNNLTDDANAGFDLPEGQLAASKWKHSFFRFDISNISGDINNATFRVYYEEENAPTFYIGGVENDNWTENGATPERTLIHNNPALQLDSKTVTGSGYIEFNVTDFVSSQVSDGVVTLELSANTGGWNIISSKEGVNPPELIISTTGGTTSGLTDDANTGFALPEGQLAASKWKHSFFRFDISNISGSINNATFRVYYEEENAPTFYIGGVENDDWSENGATPERTIIHNNPALQLDSKTVPGSGYVEFNVTGFVSSQISTDGIVTLELSANTGGWNTVSSRESENPPALNIN